VRRIIRRQAITAKAEGQLRHPMIDWNSVWKLTLLASRQGSLENGYEKDEAAERYDMSEALRQDGERRAEAPAIDLWNFAGLKAYLFMA